MSPKTPSSQYVTPMLTDMYQVTMAYSYFKHNRHNLDSSFDLFFRKNPFKGEYTIFAGLEEVLRFMENYKWSSEQVEYVKSLMPRADPAFFEWLAAVDCSEVTVFSVPEGTVMFPRVPLLRISGPIGICQLVETTLLNLVNFPSLVATQAARIRNIAGPDKNLMEFGLRRAQGPDGAMSASRYCQIGGFDGTSNVAAGAAFGLAVKGTHAHAYVQSFASSEDFPSGKEAVLENLNNGKAPEDFVEEVKKQRVALGYHETNDGELAAFTAYALSFPHGTLCLVDTYDTLYSGVPNFLVVAAALHAFGYNAVGIRLDSGDLAFLSKKTRELFVLGEEKFGITGISKGIIVASNDLNERTISALNEQGHEIDSFGVGTKLVTCSDQAALGCVYKLVEIDSKPRIKLSQDVAKVTIPGRKICYRLYSDKGVPLIDLLTSEEEPAPVADDRILCRHPFVETKRAYVRASKVEMLHKVVWDKNNGRTGPEIALLDTRSYSMAQLASTRSDHRRAMNPTPYKVAVSEKLYKYMHKLWLAEAPIAELC